MEDIMGLENLKLSAFSKLRRIQGSVNEVTIGPNATLKSPNKPTSSRIETTPTKEVKEPEVAEVTQSNTITEMLRFKQLQQQEELRERIQERVKVIEDFSKKNEEIREREWLQIQQRFIQNVQNQEMQILQTLDEYNKKSSHEHAELVRHYQDLAQRRQLQEKEMKQREMQKKILQAYLEKIKKSQGDFRLIYQQVVSILKKCTNTEELKAQLGDDFKLLKTLPQQFDELTTRCKQGKITENDVKQAEEMLQRLATLRTFIEEIVDRINAKKEEVIKPKEEIAPQQPLQPIAEVNPEPKEVSSGTEKMDHKKMDITKYVSLSNLKMYVEVMTFLEKHNKSFEALENDVSLKHFKFDCKKAVNIPVNSLSGVNASHIQEKYNKLHNLLKGKDIVIGDKVINASGHPQGVAFCADLLAKKFVSQGDLMVSGKPESAFCYATVMISLWNDFPDFGKLLLAYFYKTCPYLVPYYIPIEVGESEEEFYIKRGYLYEEGQIEKQDKFLKRMMGTMRLYFAMLIVKPKRGQNTNPHDLTNGWRWLSSMLKLEPQIDISATMLCAFLETVGFEMDNIYKIMFRKIVKIVAENYLAKCKDKCLGGAAVRLQLLLTNFYKTGKFEVAPGYVNYNYW